MPNIRGTYILAILGHVRKHNNIPLEDLAIDMSTADPYIKPVTVLKFVNELSRGQNPKLKINEDNTVSCI